MPDFSDMPQWVAITLQVTLVVVAALSGFLALRAAVDVGVKHVMDRRRAEASEGAIPVADLERRVSTLGMLIVKVAGGVIAVVAGLMLLDLFGIDVGPALAGLGIAGIAVGFGAQTLVRDWLAGIFIVLENQYNQGDVIRIVDVVGTVEDFSLRRTTLRDLDGTVHTVPNGHIVVASNMTRLWARVNLDISVAYDTDLERAAAIIDRIGEELLADETWGPRLLEAPTVARVDSLGDASVALKVLGRVQAAEQWAVTGELRKRILAEFGRAGIEIALRRRVVVSRHAEAAAGTDADAGAGTGADADADALEAGAVERIAADED